MLERINSAVDIAVHNFGASPSGKAQGFGPCTRRFESSRPSHIFCDMIAEAHLTTKFTETTEKIIKLISAALYY